MSYTITPSQDSVALDLIKQFVASMLDSNNNPLFYLGYVEPAPAGEVALYTGVLLTQPDDAGYMLADQQKPTPLAPQVTYNCTLTIRTGQIAGSYSSQDRVNAIAKAFESYLRPNGEDRTNTTLPSGRVVLGFNEFQIRPIGNDNQQRYTLAVTFKALCRAD